MPSMEDSMLFFFWMPNRLPPISDTRDCTSGSMHSRTRYYSHRVRYLACLDWLSGESRVSSSRVTKEW